MNVDGRIGTVVSRHLATLHELDTVYSYEDLLDLYEIIVIDNINELRALEKAKNGTQGNS